MIDVSFACEPNPLVIERLRERGYEVKDYGVAEGFWTIRVLGNVKPTQRDVGRICAASGLPALTLVQWREVA